MTPPGKIALLDLLRTRQTSPFIGRKPWLGGGIVGPSFNPDMNVGAIHIATILQ
jgi:hypothetical protein